MNIKQLLNTPFPRPKRSKINFLKILGLGFICSLFVIFFKPFGIENTTGIWYYNFYIISIGAVLSLSIIFVEWIIPIAFPKLFKNWTIGKGLVWYTLVILVIGAIVFIYKSYLGDFIDFTLQEYFFVMGRTFLIAITVSFFIIGFYQFINRKVIAGISVNEDYLVTSQNGKQLKLRLKDILFVSSDDNYVNIHYQNNQGRQKLLFRSSLKNIESQIVNPISPMYRCHRKFIINIKYFEIDKITSRSMTIKLKSHDEIIPVSSQYVETIKSLL
ncbi:MAG: LytTR family transcriptional regulator DNA-binding domain-containing protein [Bacteroidota bacterium]